MTQPDMQPVKSSMLTHLGFDVESFTLFARYNNGALFAYSDISPEQYERIIGDPESVGKAFNRIVRAQGRPAGEKLEDAHMVPNMEKSGSAPKLVKRELLITDPKEIAKVQSGSSGESMGFKMPEPIVDQQPAPIVEPTSFDTQEKAVETALTVAAKFTMTAIANLDERHRASQLLIEIERERRARVEWFKPIKQSAHATWKGICEREAEALNPLVAARSSLEVLMSSYDVQAERVRREQETRLRQEQEQRERERAKKEAEELRLKEAEELEAQGRHEEVSQRLSEPIVHVPRPQSAVILPSQSSNSKGVAGTKKYTFRIDDEALIPRQYMSVDESKIRRVVNALGLDANIPGVAVSDGTGFRVNLKNADKKAGKA